MTACLDLHDFSVNRNRFDLLLKLREHFPKLKVSLFTIPRLDFISDEKSLKMIKDNLDWLQIIPHGFIHARTETQFSTYGEFKNNTLPLIHEAFRNDGLPYEKGFCAPHWRWSADVVKVLDELGWWGAVSYERPKMLVPKRFYSYDYTIDKPFWESEKNVLKLHGHLYGTRNDLGKCFDNLLKLPHYTEWQYVTNFLEEKI